MPSMCFNLYKQHSTTPNRCQPLFYQNNFKKITIRGWPFDPLAIYCKNNKGNRGGKYKHRGSQVDPPAGNVKRKPDTGVQYTPGAWRFSIRLTSWNHWRILKDTIWDPPAPPNPLILQNKSHLNTKEQSPTRISPLPLVLLPQPLYNTRHKQEARPSKFQRFQSLRVDCYSSVRA